MDAFQKKTLKTSRGYTYTYYTSDGDRSLPTLFFQHGFPDHAEMWAGVASQLRPTKHPMIIPDLLGWGGTSKPTNPAEYKWDAMTQDLIDIIDNEKADQVISIGHDWGSVCASRLYNYHPSRVAGVILLSAGYTAPARGKFDLDGVNSFFEQVFGYRMFEYWYVLTAEDGPAVCKDNADRLFTVLHGTGDTMKRFLCVKDALRNHLTGSEPSPEVRPYAQDPGFKKAFIERMRHDGFDAPLCWYKAAVFNFQHENDKNLPESRDKVEVPVLYMGGKEDVVTRPEVMQPAIEKGLLPQLEKADMMAAGHWIPYEKTDEVAGNMAQWLRKNYAQ